MPRDINSHANLMRLKAFCIDGKEYNSAQNKSNLETYPDEVIDEFFEAYLNESEEDVIFISGVEPYTDGEGSITFRKLEDWITWKYPEE